MSIRDINILVIDQDPDRARLIADGLNDYGHRQVSIISEFHGLARRIDELSPDVIVMDLGTPNRDFLEHMFRLSKAIQKPVAMFVDQSSEQAMFDAIEAGVSAYVVDGLRRDRVKRILDLAIARFRAFERMRHERDDARKALEDRNTVDRAKRILIRTKQITEEEAYAELRTAAMNQNRSIGEVAVAVLNAERLLGDKRT